MSADYELTTNIYDLNKGYAKALSEFYKEQKLSPTDDKIRVFVDKKNSQILIGSAEKKGGSSFSKISKKKLANKLKKESCTTDLKIKQNAAKALLLLNWEKPVKTGKISMIFPEELGPMTKTKQKELLKIFSGDVTIDRSTEGGNGVYFIRPISDEYHRPLVLKFVKNSAQVMGADYVLQRAGFITTKTRACARDSELGEAVARKFERYVDSANPDLQGQIKQQFLAIDHHVLFMQLVVGTDLKTFSEVEIQELVESDDFGRQIGKMIVFDALIGNSDRVFS